ncbi:MAG: excinuclease ABC subunit A, partial [Bacteroidota bacterium]|nr:excinuclease ABC subunit A [Bacteroidota bacterium]
MSSITKVKKAPSIPGPISAREAIQIKGARVHNLKNISVDFPRNKFIVVTGVSGSGKSSLTIDTLFAEGQRRYAESLSAYARQFMARMDKPDVDFIKGLCPAIAIEQKVTTRTPRSTVGSMTELNDYLRLLYARVGITYSPISGREVKKHDVQDVIGAMQSRAAGDKILILVPFKQHTNRNTAEELNILLQKGFSRLYVNQEIIRIEDLLAPADGAKSKKPDLKLPKNSTFLLIDRIVSKDFDEDDLHRLADSIGTAFYEGEGQMLIEINGQEKLPFTNRFEMDGIRFEEPVPNLFSFNNPYGACPVCEGFGQVLGIDADLVIPDKRLSVFEGAVAPWKGEKLGAWKDYFVKAARKFDFPIHKPIIDLTKAQYQLLWEGNKEINGIDDFFKEVERNLYKVQYRVLLSRYRGRTSCPDCKGYRLRQEALYVRIGGLHIGELCEMPVGELSEWFNRLSLSLYQQQVAKRILIEIHNRLKTLLDVGLGYLTLNRLANSLSGGESQRIQLTRSLGSNLTNSLYILDEPSIGLHARDTQRLIGVLKELRDLGNTVVVV